MINVLDSIRRVFNRDANTRNSTIDTYRLLAAFAIVFIHVSITSFGFGNFANNSLTMTLLIVAKIAVPLFFALSGFLIYRGTLKETSSQAKKQAIKIASLLLLSSALYIVFKFYYQQPIDPTPLSIVNLVLFNSTEFFSPPLWFLAALLYLLIFYHLVMKFTRKHTEKIIIVIASISFLIGIATYTYGNVFFQEPVSLHIVRNFLFFGLPYFTLGYLAAKHARRIPAIKKSSLLKFAFLAISAYVFEYIVLSEGGNLTLGTQRYDFYFFMPLVVVLLLCVAVRHPKLFSRTPLPSLGRQYAVYIYIVHLIIITVVYTYIIGFDLKINSENKMFAVFIVCCLLSLLVSMLYVKIKTILKKLYEEKIK